ncbi:MAG: MFS transporter [Desulfatibacillaceae bacterium]|nr:MFS transporter [Desulfatibacillaceae bacterium]
MGQKNTAKKTREFLKAHPARALGALYFCYFGVLGVWLPYFNLYCHHLGFSPLQIGVLSGVKTAAVVVMPLFWGILADRFAARRQIFILANAASTGMVALYFVSDQFYPMLAITLAYSVFYSPLVSFMEAFSMEILGANRNRYGAVRVWGSISFIVFVLAVGNLIGIWGVKIILPVILAGSVLQALISPAMPRVKAMPVVTGASLLRHFANTEVIVFQVCAFLMLLSHGAYYGFLSIYLEGLGYGGLFIGAAWALATLAEILVMLGSQRIFGAISVRAVFFASLAFAVLRWILLASFAAWPVILAAQLLHALTYGAFHVASILYMEKLIPPQARTLGQAVNNAMTYGLGLSVGFLLTGLVYETSGPARAFQASAVAAAAGFAVFGLFLLLKNRKA